MSRASIDGAEQLPAMGEVVTWSSSLWLLPDCEDGLGRLGRMRNINALQEAGDVVLVRVSEVEQ